MTFEQFLGARSIPLRQYGKRQGCYLVFEDEVAPEHRWDMYHLEDYYVSSSVSGPGYVLCVRIHSLA